MLISVSLARTTGLFFRRSLSRSIGSRGIGSTGGVTAAPNTPVCGQIPSGALAALIAIRFETQELNVPQQEPAKNRQLDVLLESRASEKPSLRQGVQKVSPVAGFRVFACQEWRDFIAD